LNITKIFVYKENSLIYWEALNIENPETALTPISSAGTLAEGVM